ncbi:MAG: radical SAM protein [Deltaproteobacteria bacterium]|nr:radical SAM protein [Deltaproteobacteria bacterium]MBW2047492.1 radical SAM protein [Deltaproteobacteria bacterium]MBW2111718.1 radical SAM protein [Deltaproteobacteria bacterium]MBW2352083.1 radical SAM protein [Deltaproteobacteria bacterium]
MKQSEESPLESPRFLRMSLAAAITLGFKPGLFYRKARLYCINLLLTYRSGCAARCAYCGLSTKRPGSYSEKSFIRVTWPTYPLDDIIERISQRQDRVKRICISMVTNRRATGDTREVCARLRSSLDIPVSLLISPTILDHDDLISFREAGADKIGVAIDLATRELFDRYRGTGVGGPHRWEAYWNVLSQSVELFGRGNAGPHFMVGMGETEKEMCDAMQRARDMGGTTHLFSFFPEADSLMADHPIPSMGQYRRVQLARFLIDNRLVRAEEMTYDSTGRITDFSLSPGELDRVVDSGRAFRTSGCVGYDGEVACNRPYANSRPGPDIRNFPFPPDESDILRIREQLGWGRGQTGAPSQTHGTSALPLGTMGGC